MTSALDAFVAEVGPPEAGAVVAVGGGTDHDLGGSVAEGTRPVRAPVGIVAHQPEEMTVRVGAGTVVADLDAELGARGQCVALPARPGATVGGVLAVGRSGIRRLGWGPVRDALLEARCASSDGRPVVCGGPTVKNVSGYDLCRLLIGSLGTLALIGEVVLRTRPTPQREQWYRVVSIDPFELRTRLHRPASLLWNGATTWVLLDGHPADVDAEAARAGIAGTEVEAASVPDLPPHRWSVRPTHVGPLAHDGRGPFVAEVGVGVAHREVPQARHQPDAAVVALNRRVKALFDPTGRLAPGRVVL